ncbi:hypothetical protein ACODT4_44415 [Streptomyces sp. 2.9]|uniref:hypothetical protein n=1 Tax=Streptomyces tritrimontium TaxID=3406573 RepID=UPI003BB72AD1
MTPPTTRVQPIWQCPDCDTNNDATTDAQCIACDRDRPVSPHLEIGVVHGRHDGKPVLVTATRRDDPSLPYGWSCSCGIAQRVSSRPDLENSAWRHAHPPRWRYWARKVTVLRQVVQPTARPKHAPHQF